MKTALWVRRRWATDLVPLIRLAPRGLNPSGSAHDADEISNERRELRNFLPSLNSDRRQWLRPQGPAQFQREVCSFQQRPEVLKESMNAPA